MIYRSSGRYIVLIIKVGLNKILSQSRLVNSKKFELKSLMMIVDIISCRLTSIINFVVKSLSVSHFRVSPITSEKILRI